ncbi:MAG TPA: MurR/RpiR family transcriptional regulator [Candidatus Limnocylindria bacterium]
MPAISATATRATRAARPEPPERRERGPARARSAPHLDERIAARWEHLPPAEQRVVDFIREHREEIVFLSAAEIARDLATSDATVIRAAQSLGYAGLPELKNELQGALRSRATPTLRLGRSLEELGDDPGAILEHILATERQLIEDARDTVRPADFARALALLDAADRILVFGIGPMGFLAGYFALRLGRLRRDARPLTGRGPALADALLGMRKGDVLVAITFERSNAETEAVLRRADALRLPVILLTDNLALALSGRFTVSLSARRAGTGMWHQSAITVVLLDALLLGLAARDRAAALAAAEELQDLRDGIAATG